MILVHEIHVHTPVKLLVHCLRTKDNTDFSLMWPRVLLLLSCKNNYIPFFFHLFACQTAAVSENNLLWAKSRYHIKPQQIKKNLNKDFEALFSLL